VSEAGPLLIDVKSVRATQTVAIGPTVRETMIIRSLADCVPCTRSLISMRPLANSIA